MTARNNARGDGLWQVLLALAAMAAAAFGSSLTLPFVGDDYVFLDLTRDPSLARVLARRDVHFGWYRPWSRDLHFWVLQHVAGANPLVFRLAGIVLWVAGLACYFVFVRRLANQRVASIATIGVAALALWGTPLLWVSGSQDLWMVLWAMLCLLAFARRQSWLVLPLYALALLSKETAAVLPAVLAAYVLLIERAGWRQLLRRVGPVAAITLVWLVVHPTLLARLASPQPDVPELRDRPALPLILARNVLALINLDVFPKPAEVTPGVIARWIVTIAATVGALLWLTSRATAGSPDESASPSRNVSGFAVAWALLAWTPLVLPSIGWHAYYGCLGAMGAWIVIAQICTRDTRTLAALFGGLALLACLHASTPSNDWGDEWYQRRAGNLLSAIRDNLLAQKPALPRYSRVFFVEIPNNIGLIAGSSPALHVWYDDPTLKAGFYTYYRPRHANEPPGEDFFFRLDMASGLIEVHEGPENVRAALALDPHWEADHQTLAVTLLSAGAPREAASEFAKLAQLPDQAEALVYAAVCWRLVGEESRAESLLATFATRTGMPRVQVDTLAAALRGHLPPPLPPPPSGSGFE